MELACQGRNASDSAVVAKRFIIAETGLGIGSAARLANATGIFGVRADNQLKYSLYY